MLYYTIFLVAMFTAIVLIPPLIYIFNKFDLVDIPSPRKVHDVPVPRVGGIAIVIGTVIPIIGGIHFDLPLIGMLLGIAILFVLGVIDDAKNLGYKSKFTVQIMSVVLVFALGFIDIGNSYYVVNEILPGPIILALYLIFVLGVTNAINLADGLDGLAGGEALLAFSIIGLLAYESDNITIVLMVLAIVGAVFGFLRFNTYPAKIFMGDTGSLFLGFVLGVLSVALTYGVDSAYAKTLPLLLVGLPVFDTIMVMWIRLYNKQSPFNADRNHLHHKLLDNGYKHYQSVLIIYFIQSIYILTAYFMRYDSEVNVILAFIVISLFAYFVGRSRIRNTALADDRSKNNSGILAKAATYIESNSNNIFTLLCLMLLLFTASSIVNINDIKYDILLLLAAIASLAVIGLVLFAQKPCTWLERISIHIIIVLSIYFDTRSSKLLSFDNLHLLLLVLSVGLIIVLMLGKGEKKFVGSPLDFLLIATAIVIPNLPNSPISDTGLSVLVIKLIMLFYCIEYVLFNIKHNWWAIRTTLALSASVPIFINIM